MSGSHWLVFTDLDATLLDPDTYSADEALPLLSSLARRGIPVVPVTSKTRAEVLVLRQELSLSGPYVTENGAGIFVPDASGAGDLALGSSPGYPEIRAAFQDLAREFDVVGFGDLADDEVGRLTGLAAPACARARQREFSEPFLLREPHRLAAFVQRASERGLRVLKGGRFFHLLPSDASKGRALELLRDAFQSQWGARPRTLALGDSPNDLEMLRAADLGVVVPGPAGPAAGMDLPGLSLAPYAGPRGWAAAVAAAVGPG